MAYQFNEMVIPDHMLDGLREYVDHGIPQGHFLTAVITNDLKEACARADRTNLRIIPAYVAWLYNEADARCWGSREKMDAWIDAKREARKAASP